MNLVNQIRWLSDQTNRALTSAKLTESSDHLDGAAREELTERGDLVLCTHHKQSTEQKHL